MRRGPDVECHLKRAVGVECVLLLESFVIAVRLRDRDVHVDAPRQAIRVGAGVHAEAGVRAQVEVGARAGVGGNPDHIVRQGYGTAGGTAVISGPAEDLCDHLADSHRAVCRRI